MNKVLFVDDNKTMREAAALILKDYDLQIAEDRPHALEYLKSESFDLILTDLYLHKLTEGLSLIRAAREVDEDLYIVVISGFGTIENTVQAMKAGADHFLPKEFSPEELRVQVKKFLSEREERIKLKKLEAENMILKEKLFESQKLIGTSAAMQEIRKKIVAAAQDNQSTVLILGKSGTGKELAAQEIHENSTRQATGTFMAIDCPTIPKDLFESELFGYEKGAFTDAREKKRGRIELANMGTLFLDEIGDLPLPMQAKLLRFLETSQFFRVGGTRPVKVDVRILASTNRNLKQMIERGEFREDLFYRLQVLVFEMPELKERNSDIQELANHFLNLYTKKKGKRLELSLENLQKLIQYDWPGNVRELKNVIESYSILGELPRLSGLPHPSAAASYKDARKAALEKFEKRYIGDALALHQRNITKTARSIGLSREELSRKIKKLEL